jgi:hypothetical protein
MGLGGIVMADEKVFTARFKVEDDGSIVLDKISGKLVDVGKKGQESLNSIMSSLSIIKLDSLINLGERAFHVGEQIYGMARQAASSTNEIERMAKIAGLSTDIYQKMAYAAKMTDVDTESLSRGMKILAGHMDDVRKGSTEAVSLFGSIGVSTTDAYGKIKSFDEILGDLANRFKAMPNGVEKVALAVDLFGKSGQNLIPYLNEGKEGLKRFYEEAQRLGVVMDKSMIEKGVELDNQFKRIEAAASSFFKKVVVGAYGAASAMVEYKKSQDEVIKAQVMAAGYWLPEEEKAGTKPISRIWDPKEIETGVVFIRQSEEALKAMNKMLQEAAKNEWEINRGYETEAEKLARINDLLQAKNNALKVMAELGVKSQEGAKAEIETIVEKFKVLLGKGFKPEELAEARIKTEEQLRAIAEKYAKPSGWQATGEEGGVRVWSSTRPDEMTKNVFEMVEKSIQELQRMQKAAMEVKSPTVIAIDYKPVEDANSAATMLRTTLQDLSSRDWPIVVTIQQKISSEGINVIEDELGRRFENKQSRLGSIIRREIEGGVEFSNR